MQNKGMSMEGIKMRQNTKNVSPMSNEGRNQYVVEHITDAREFDSFIFQNNLTGIINA